MRQLVGFGDQSMGRAILGANMRCPTVNIGEVAALWPLPKSIWNFFLLIPFLQ